MSVVSVSLTLTDDLTARDLRYTHMHALRMPVRYVHRHRLLQGT